jgi:hypothetical protein
LSIQSGFAGARFDGIRGDLSALRLQPRAINREIRQYVIADDPGLLTEYDHMLLLRLGEIASALQK